MAIMGGGEGSTTRMMNEFAPMALQRTTSSLMNELGDDLVTINSEGSVAELSEGAKAKVYGLPASANVMGVQLFAATVLGDKCEFTQCNIMEGAQHTPEFGRVNPFRQIPAFTDVDGTSLGDSNAILLYLAEKYGPQYLMKGQATAVWALEAISSYVYGGGFTTVVYPVMGYATPPEDFQLEVCMHPCLTFAFTRHQL